MALEKDKPATNAQRDRFGAGVRAELAKDRGNMKFDRVLGDA
jgi:hypothetical protein